MKRKDIARKTEMQSSSSDGAPLALRGDEKSLAWALGIGGTFS